MKVLSCRVRVFNTKPEGLADTHRKYAASFPDNSVITLTQRLYWCDCDSFALGCLVIPQVPPGSVDIRPNLLGLYAVTRHQQVGNRIIQQFLYGRLGVAEVHRLRRSPRRLSIQGTYRLSVARA